MRSAFMLGTLIALSAFTASCATSRDDVKVYGNVRAVSAADIHEATTTGIGNEKASAVRVISSNEMRVYLQPPDLGWVPVQRSEEYEPVGRNHHLETRVRWRGAGLWIYDPKVLAVIRAAKEVYVFPVASPLKPRRDNEHMRALNREARRKVVRLLGNKRSWWDAFYDLIIIDDGSRGLGLLFRHDRDEVVIFWSQITTEQGTFNGENIGGLLNHGPEQQMERWVHRYAQPELPIK